KRTEQRVEDQHAAKAEGVQDRLRRRLHGHRAGGGDEGERAGLKGGEIEAQLQKQRQEKGDRADADAKEETADERRAEGRNLQEPEIENRRRRAPGVTPIKQQGAHAGDEQRDDDEGGGLDLAPREADTEDRRRKAESAEQRAGNVERPDLFFGQIGNEERRENDADKADRRVDPEDVAPVEIGRDEAADRGTDQGADQRRDRQPGHRGDEIGLWRGAQ